MIIHLEITGGSIKDTLVSVKDGLIYGVTHVVPTLKFGAKAVYSTLANVPYKRLHIVDVREKAPKSKSRKAVALTAEA